MLVDTSRRKKVEGKAIHYHMCYSIQWLICLPQLLNVQKMMGGSSSPYWWWTINLRRCYYSLYEHDQEKARNLTLILLTFEQLSGLEINFYKSELLCLGEVQDDTNLYVELFGCGLGQFLISHLGIPIHFGG
jgi:hypothetical protein